MSEHAAQTAALNDAFRSALGGRGGGRVVLTRQMAALPPEQLGAVLGQVARFAAFTPENDPYGEHDFGNLTADGCSIYWKIDYYADAAMAYGAENPRDCYRVLTIMAAEEY